jgi:Glycosyltransferase family 87
MSLVRRILFILRRKGVVLVFLLAMTSINFTLLFYEIPKLRNGYQDFTIFYTAARLIREGHGSSLYSLAAQYQMQQTFTNVPIRQGPLPFNHPPFEAFFFIPFTLLSYWPAYVLWSGCNVIMLAAIIILLRRNFQQIAAAPILSVGLAATAFFPLMIGLIQGQDIILLLLLFVLATIYLDRGQDALAGVFLGAGLFRPHTVVPLVILLAFRRWKVLIGFAAIALVLFGVSVAFMGWRGPFDYVQFVLHVELTKAIAFGTEATPNLRGLIEQLPWVKDSRTVTDLLIFATSAIVFLLAVRRIFKENDSISFCASLTAVTTILVSFHAFVYDLSLLFPVLLFLLARVLAVKETGNVNKVAGETKLEMLSTLLFIFMTLVPLYLYLLLRVEAFFCFSLILLLLYFKLLLMPAPVLAPV